VEKESFADLSNASRRPANSPTRTAASKEQAVIGLRNRYGWGAKKIQLLLKGRRIELTIATINRILSRNGLVKPEDSHRQATRRFQRETPNELWQMDFKGWYAYMGRQRVFTAGW
jgi:hypothetical protein